MVGVGTIVIFQLPLAGSPTIREVAEKHYREEVFQTPEQLLQNIKRIYSATTPNTQITLIRF
ncbi:MAG: hypothetical protein QXY84_06270, partial [Candidatus Caldarchaeum sp.]